MSAINIDSSLRYIKRGLGATGKLIGNNIRNTKTVAVGNPITGKIAVEGSETLIYTHGLGNEPDSLTIVSAPFDKSTLIFGNGIIIKQTASGAWVFDALDPDVQVQFMSGITAIPDQTPVNLNQLEYGTLQPHSGMVLRVLSAMYGNDYVRDTLTADFSTGTVQDTDSNNIVIPTTNNRAIGVLIQVTPSTGILSYKQSISFYGTTSLQSQFNQGKLPNPDSTAYRIGYLKLVKGVTSADYSHIWQVPEMYSKGSVEWEITLSANRTLPANKQIVLDKLIISSGITLIVESTAIMKVI